MFKPCFLALFFVGFCRLSLIFLKISEKISAAVVLRC